MTRQSTRSTATTTTRRSAAARAQGYQKIVGTKREVWKGIAKRTPGGLTIDKLMENR